MNVLVTTKQTPVRGIRIPGVVWDALQLEAQDRYGGKKYTGILVRAILGDWLKAQQPELRAGERETGGRASQRGEHGGRNRKPVGVPKVKGERSE